MRRYELVDRDGDTVETCDTLLEAVRDCPVDGAIVDTATARVMDFADVLAGPLGPMLTAVRT